MKAGRIIAAIAAAALSVTLVACGNSSLSQELLDEASGVRIEAENATADNVASTEGAITVGENDLIVISPNLDKGSLHVTITSDDDGTVVYDEDVDGKVLFSVEAPTGTYSVETSGNGATGSMTVFAEDADEYMALDVSLDEALAETGAGSDVEN